MGKPNESLDEYVVKPAPETTSEPPHGVSPPLADKPKALPDTEVSEPVGNTFLVWIHRVVAVGSLVALIAFILLGAFSVFLFVINEPSSERRAATSIKTAEEREAMTGGENAAEADAATNGNLADDPESATNGQYDDEPELTTDGQPADQGKGPFSSNIFSASNAPRINVTRSKARQNRARRRARAARYKRKRAPRWTPRPLEQLFIPTTLVIYVENGVIKTRTEPWLQSTSIPRN